MSSLSNASREVKYTSPSMASHSESVLKERLSSLEPRTPVASGPTGMIHSDEKILRTDWYEGHQKPVRVGLYQRLYRAGIFFCYWDGECWYQGDPVRGVAMILAGDMKSTMQNLPWRGLARNPEL